MGFITNALHKISGRHVLTDDDRKAAAELNAERFRIKKEELQRQAEINKLRDERLISKLTSGDQEGQALMAILAAAMSSNQNKPVAQIEQASPQAIHLSNEDIEQAIAQLPKAALKIGKTMSPDAIKQFVFSKIGPVDDDTLGRIINRIKA